MTQDTEDDDDGINTKEKDHWLNQYRLSRPGSLGSVLDVVIDEVTFIEERARKRRAKDAETFRLVTDVVVSNLAYSLLRHPEGKPLVISRDTGGRRAYDNPAIPRATFVQTVDLLEAAGFLTQAMGARGRGLTTIRATSRLAALVSGLGVDLGCFRIDRNYPLLMLRRKVVHGPGQPPTRRDIEFQDTPETERIRLEMSRLNSFLAGADLEFIPDGLGLVDTINDRTLSRRFVVLNDQAARFDQVGRLSGGFWTNLEKDRRGSLRIQGEPIADLDFEAMHPRIAYLLLGKEWSQDDPYDLTGLLDGYDHSNKEHRSAVKKGLSSLLNGGRAGRKYGKPLEGLPPGATPASLRAALKAKHPALVPIIDPPVPLKVPLGYRLMKLESDILLEALDHLMSLSVVALPSHDGVFVAQSNTAIAQEALQEASKFILDVTLPVKPKPVPEPIQPIPRAAHNQPTHCCA
ncbi:hypothetical protein SAMN02799622_00791 [Methylobacterium sp. UNC378MF]|uniref:hypothetical protein n=1 Tax=Methylobacterium sp. UNC378MF TaxID=1502748 RepID=UPI0008881785|nr:hypothetical protein [Methylobacterium sp. UNC378MF]SDA12726.1 hypothetical protein SAMN02799622_00791 [Methylobacterium sp. UNC378MF]